MLLLMALAACGGSGGGNVNLPDGVPTQAVAINVVSALVTPAPTLNGGVFPKSEYDDGNFSLRGDTPDTASDVVPLGSSHDSNPPAVRVVQGDYDVLYQHETGDSVPQNRDMPAQTNIDITSVPDPFPVAVTAWTVTPTFLLNGGAFPASEYDDGVFYLRSVTGGENIFLGNSHTAMPAGVLVIDGIYDVIYSLETGGDQAPNNQAAIIMSDVVINGDTALTVDVSSVHFQLNVMLDTAAFPSSQYQQAELFLRNTTTGDRVDLGTSFELPATQYVVEGTYDIIYRHVQGNLLPGNSDAVLASNVLINDANPMQTIDISSVLITPTFNLNGNPFEQSEYQDANFFLRSMSNNDDEILLGSSHFLTPAAVRVISSTEVGNYDVLYRHETGDAVPQNANALILANQLLATDGELAIDVTTVDVAGVFALNGNNFPSDASDSVQFFLRGDEPSDVFLFAYSDLANNEPVKLVSMPGSYDTYDVMMDHLAGDAVPQNEMHAVDFNNVLDMNKTLRVNVPAVRVDPSFSLDGAAFPASIYQSATFYLRDIHTGRRIFLGHSYKNNNPVMVIKEDHEIIYEHAYGDQVPQNLNKLLQVVDL